MRTSRIVKHRWAMVLYQLGLVIALVRSLAWLAGHHLTVFWAVLGGSLAVYLFLVFWRAKYQTDGSPRQDMYICQVHGPMPKSAVITLFSEPMDYVVDGKTKRGPVQSCPLCFENACKVAKTNLEKQQR